MRYYNAAGRGKGRGKKPQRHGGTEQKSIPRQLQTSCYSRENGNPHELRLSKEHESRVPFPGLTGVFNTLDPPV